MRGLRMISQRFGTAMNRRAQTVQRRFMSGDDHAAHAKSVEFNKNATYGGIALCAVLFVYNMGLHFTHDHHHESVQYPYMKKRTKPLPWSCNNCDLFDMPCWKKCKEERAAA